MTSLVWPESSIVKPTTCRIPQHCLKVWRCEVYLCSRHSTVPHVNQYLLAMELGLWNSLELDDLTLTVNDYGTCPIQKSLYSSKKKVTSNTIWWFTWWFSSESSDFFGFPSATWWFSDNKSSVWVVKDLLSETKDETSERFCRQELKSIERLERAPERNLSAGSQGGEPRWAMKRY